MNSPEGLSSYDETPDWLSDDLLAGFFHEVSDSSHEVASLYTDTADLEVENALRETRLQSGGVIRGSDWKVDKSGSTDSHGRDDFEIVRI